MGKMIVSALVLLLVLSGCGTAQNLIDGPAIYGGVRHDLRFMNSDPESMVFNLCDLPFSAVLDTGILSLTALFELIRWLSGWPSPPRY